MVTDIHIPSQNISEMCKSNFGTKVRVNRLNPSVPIFPLDFPMILFPRIFPSFQTNIQVHMLNLHLWFYLIRHDFSCIVERETWAFRYIGCI